MNASAEADAQRLKKYERAKTYFNYASQIDIHHKWKLINVDNVGHDYFNMAKAAQNFLLNPTSIVDNNKVIINDFQLY